MLDVVRDYRWGRVEETLGEDPYLVATLGTAYVAGLQSAGVVATLKHFAGYAASRAGRNHGPVPMGRRELVDVILPPFEMAITEGGAGSVMNSYSDVDGVPAGADPWLLTELLRGEWGFSGTVVSDYWAVSFLETMHRVADSPGDAAALALVAGIDVELPDTRCYGSQLATQVDIGNVGEELLDRSVRRVLLQKLRLGLLDADWSPDLDDARSIDVPVPTLLEALRAQLPLVRVTHAAGCSISGAETAGFPSAVAAAAGAELAVVVVGDRAGLFGRGTSGEGCDAEDLALPGVQGDLVEEILETGTPVVLVVVSGRPYALGAYAGRAVAVIQSFFPGEEGGTALAGVLSGRVVPSGKLPVQVPASPGGQPGTYLHPLLGGPGQGVSSLNDVALYPFGHGLSYTSFTYGELRISPAEIDTSAETEISCTVTNTGDRAGTEVVQLYLSDPVAQATRPVRQLAAYARADLRPGQSAQVRFRLHAERTAYTDRRHRRIVEPGRIDVLVGASSTDIRLRGRVQIGGQPRVVPRPVLRTSATVHPVGPTQACR